AMMTTPSPDPANPTTAPVVPDAPLPEGVRVGTAHGVDAVLVQTPAASATLLFDGAHLISWVPAGGSEVLWLSPDSGFGPGVAVRGGIPLVGPWFGPGRDGSRSVKHGWLRTLRWELASARREGDEVELTLTVADQIGRAHV